MRNQNRPSRPPRFAAAPRILRSQHPGKQHRPGHVQHPKPVAAPVKLHGQRAGFRHRNRLDVVGLRRPLKGRLARTARVRLHACFGRRRPAQESRRQHNEPYCYSFRFAQRSSAVLSSRPTVLFNAVRGTFDSSAHAFEQALGSGFSRKYVAARPHAQHRTLNTQPV